MPNLETRAGLKEAIRTESAWAHAGKVLLPGKEDAELFIATVFEGSDLRSLSTRLEEIEASNFRTNNTRLVLHTSGLYANVLKEEEKIDPRTDPSGYGNPVPVTEILYADIDRRGELTPAEVDVIARMKSNYIAPDKIIRLEADGAIVPVRRPEELSLEEIRRRVRGLGGFYSDEILDTLHVNLIHNPSKHFVILRGISGTGKSRLAKSYAYAVLGENSLSSESQRFVVVPVEPQWTDPSFLIGHEDILSEAGYSQTPFLEALVLASSDPLQPVFVLLDEMNRAQVEHYFSNFLSAMELESPIRFHSNSKRIADVPATIDWPRNLYLIGTINDDESVIPFSAMVLDRANSQDLSHTDVVAYTEWLRANEPLIGNSLSNDVASVLEELTKALVPFQLHFGNRTVRELALYLRSADLTGTNVNALDVQIDQKILPKLRGGEEAADMLKTLASILTQYPASLARVQRMQDDLDILDFFKYR